MSGAVVTLSIIIVNYRAWGHVREALCALRDGFPDDWEVIVVDNASEPGPFKESSEAFPWVRFIANRENSGFGRGCNLGVAKSTGTHLLFMNPDVIATSDQLRTLMREKEAHPDVALLSPKQVDTHGRPQKVFDDFPSLPNRSRILKALLRLLFPSRYLDPRADHESLTYCDWITGSCVLVHRRDFDTIGGWCEDYWMYVEDADLCKRAHDRGLRAAYTPSVQVVHAHGGSSRINVDVTALTKTEVIISKHVYTQNHGRGLRRRLGHLLTALFKLPVLVPAALLDLLFLRRVPFLRVRSKMLGGLIGYYLRALRTGEWRSPRALANRVSGQAGVC